MKKRIILPLFLLLSILGFAQKSISTDSLLQANKEHQLNEVVLSDTRFALERKYSGKPIIKITSKEISKFPVLNFSQLLSTKSGIEINGRHSHLGQNRGIYIRGGNNRQVLVFVDGVQQFDASQIALDFDLRLISPETISSIEITKGAMSTLYGGQAATAVINITTKDANNKPISGSFSTLFSTYSDQENLNFDTGLSKHTVNLNGRIGKFKYMVSSGYEYSDGLSAIKDLNSYENDLFKRANLLLKTSYIGEKVKTALSYRYVDIYNDYDNTFPKENAPFSYRGNQYHLSNQSSLNHAFGRLHLNTAISKYTRDNRDNYPSVFNAQSIVADLYNLNRFGESILLVTGINFKNYTSSFAKSNEINEIDPYINATFISKFGFNLNSGIRLNTHSSYGNFLVYNLNPSYALRSDTGILKFYTSYATAYIPPSIFQLFGTFGANPNLIPEENESFELGTSWKTNKETSFSATYFNRSEINKVIYGAKGYINTSETMNTQGFELDGQIKIIELLSWNANYTHILSFDDSLIRIPQHKVTNQISYNPNKNVSLTISYSYLSERNDTGKVKLEPYKLWDTFIGYTFINNGLSLNFALTNILNETYTEIDGYSTLGRNMALSLNFKF